MDLIIDGVPYDVKASITRTAEVRATDVSGAMLNGDDAAAKLASILAEKHLI